MTSDILKRAAEAVEEPHRIYINRAMVFDEGVTFTTVAGLYPHAYVPEDAYLGLRTLIPDMAAAIAERDAENARLTARAEAAEAMVDRDADLLLDAYKALLVLHRMLDKHGLTAGVEAANSLANRIVAAHPEMPGRAAMKEGQ